MKKLIKSVTSSIVCIGCGETLLIPADYSVVRSQYDPKNDVMYIFARQDTNHDGAAGKNEPLHIFGSDHGSRKKAKR